MRNKVKTLTIIFIIVLITMISFFGVYVKKQNRMENKLKDYSYTMDIKGSRTIRLKVDTSSKEIIKDKDGKIVESATEEEIEKNGYIKEEVPYNNQDDLIEDNYKLTKNIIQERLKKLDVEDYNIRLDKSNGDIILEISENDQSDSIVSNINTIGKFEIVDSQTQEVLINNNNIKLANVLYNSSNSGTNVYLNIEFNKEGTKKLEEISTTYVKSEENNTTSEENTSEEQEQTVDKQIAMKLDDEEIMSTSFEEPIKTGKMQLSVGQAATDKKTLQGYIEQATNMATILDCGKLPIKYNVQENKYILSDINNETMKKVIICTAIIALIGLVILIFRFKMSGLLGAFSIIGLIALHLLTIRYTNVILSINGVFAIIIVAILDYILINIILSKMKKAQTENKDIQFINKTKTEAIKEFFIKIIPVCIISIVFCFIKWIPINSFGMVMFWGILIIAIYNLLITNNLLKLETKK